MFCAVQGATPQHHWHWSCCDPRSSHWGGWFRQSYVTQLIKLEWYVQIHCDPSCPQRALLYPAIWVLAKGWCCWHCWGLSISSCGSWHQETEASTRYGETPEAKDWEANVGTGLSISQLNVIKFFSKVECFSEEPIHDGWENNTSCHTCLLFKESKSLGLSWGKSNMRSLIMSISPCQGQQHCEPQLDREHGAQMQVGKCWIRFSETWFLIG